MFICGAVVLLACLPGGKEPEPPPVMSWDMAPSWSNAGDRIAYTSPGIDDSIYSHVLYVIDTNGQNRTLLSVGGLHAAWLPGDTAMIYMKGDFKLYYLDLTTMQESLLCDFGFARFPDIDSTGRWLYYEDRGVANNWATSIYRMDLTTGDTVHIVGGTQPRLSHDQRYLLYTRQEVYKYDLTADSETALFSPGFQAFCDWSPDDSEILIGNVFPSKEHGITVYRVDSDGSNRRHFSYGRWPTFSPGGDRIAVVRPGSDNKYHVWLIDNNGNNPKQLTF